jgi:tRNA(Ile)-lysidine synthase
MAGHTSSPRSNATVATVHRLLLAAAQRSHLFEPGQQVIVAVSGGADSVGMLYSLAGIAGVLPLRLHVVHVHHGLRGAQADADAVLAGQHARALGVPFTLRYVDVATYRAGRARSPQDAARRARYAALRAVAATEGATAIVTAHTQDDQAETVLLHLLRGSGLDGLAGMRPRSGDLVRPLLEVTHAQTIDYCRTRGLAWREDASNADRHYRRNALRLDLLPLLETYNPRVRQGLARLAVTVDQDLDLLAALAAEALQQVRQSPVGETGVLVLDRPRHAALHPALRLRVLRLAIAAICGGTAGFHHQHLLAVDRALCGPGRHLLQLPHLLQVDIAAETCTLRLRGPAETAGQASDAPAEVLLPVPGTVHFGTWRIESRICALTGPVPRLTHLPGQPDEFWCSTKAARALRVRSRRTGDRLVPFGMHGSRSLQDLFVDRKVPRAIRTQTPVVEGAMGILWVAGLAGSETARIQDGEQQAVVLRACPAP